MKLNLYRLIVSVCVVILYTINLAFADRDVETEANIGQMLEMEFPYHVRFQEFDFIINDVNIYPPDIVSSMFADFITDHNIAKNKVVADIAGGCFILGMASISNGAKRAIGFDVSAAAINCAKDNLLLNNTSLKYELFQGEELSVLVPEFAGKIDVIFAKIPLDNIQAKEFEAISTDRKLISKSFYDVDNKLSDSLMTDGFKLLAPHGKLYIAFPMVKLERVKQICKKHNLSYSIVYQEDLYDNGNMYSILELKSKNQL